MFLSNLLHALFDPQTLLNGLLIGGIYALISVGLSLLFGVVDIVNFAHGEYLMLGMYIAVLSQAINPHFDPFYILFISVIVMFIVGVLIQRFLFDSIMNAQPITQIFLTVGLQLILQNIVLLISPDTKVVKSAFADHALSWSMGNSTVGISLAKVCAFLIAILMAACLGLFLTRTDLGRSMRAAAQDRDVSMLMGININKIFYFAAGISAGITGAAGTIISSYTAASPGVGSDYGLMAYITVILGSLGNLKGAFLGGLILGLAESIGMMTIDNSSGRLFVFGIFLIVMLFKPEGLFAKRRRAA